MAKLSGTIQTTKPDPSALLAHSKQAAAPLADLLLEARRISATITAGWHGRRTHGQGETFWQFRPYEQGLNPAKIDWRRSARDEATLYLKDHEWEAAQTAWLWPDTSPSMAFTSSLSQTSKQDRALTLTLALADLLAKGGERVGHLGRTKALHNRNAATTLARTITQPTTLQPHALTRNATAILISDFLNPLEETQTALNTIASKGARPHLIQVLDPIEETFPYIGRTEFTDPETGSTLTVTRAQDYRADYQAKLIAHRHALKTMAQTLGGTFALHHTHKPATPALLALSQHLTQRRHP